MSVISWGVAPGLLVAFGWAIASLAGARVSSLGRVAAPAVSLVVGVAALNVITTSLAVLGCPIRPWPATGPLVVATIAGAVAVRLHRPRAQRGSERWSLEAAPLLTVVFAIPIVVTSAAQRVTSNDEYAIWALKGRALAGTGHLDAFMFSGEPMLAYSSRDYPLLLPSLQVWAEGWHGSACEPLAIVMTALLSTSALIVSSAALARIAGGVASGLASVAVFSLTGFAPLATKFMADAPLVACALALIAVVQLRLVPAVAGRLSGRDFTIVATALAAACGGLKNEGLAFALAILLGAAITRRAQWRILMLPLVGVIGAFAPWAMWCRLHGVDSNFVNSDTVDMSALEKLGRIPGIFAAMGEHWPGSSILIPLALVAWAVAFVLDRSPAAAMYLLSSLFVMGALVATYIIAPRSDSEFLASNMPRVLLLPAALIATSLPVLAAMLLRGETRRGRDRSSSYEPAV